MSVTTDEIKEVLLIVQDLLARLITDALEPTAPLAGDTNTFAGSTITLAGGTA